MMNNTVQQAATMIKASPNTVVVTGAGISTEAGIPDFRGKNGIYRKLGEDRVMEIINISFFRSHPEQFYEFYREYFSFPQVEPARAHYLLAAMEQKGLVKTIVTQNIDYLHQKAGSRRVIAIHGNGGQFACQNRSCNTIIPADEVDLFDGRPVPLCPLCHSLLKPDVVLFGENIQNYHDAYEAIMGAKLIIVIGSSLTVYPLAGFVREFNNFTQDLMIINKGTTALDHAAQLKIDTDNTGDLLEEILNLIEA